MTWYIWQVDCISICSTGVIVTVTVTNVIVTAAWTVTARTTRRLDVAQRARVRSHVTKHR